MLKTTGLTFLIRITTLWTSWDILGQRELKEKFLLPRQSEGRGRERSASSQFPFSFYTIQDPCSTEMGWFLPQSTGLSTIILKQKHNARPKLCQVWSESGRNELKGLSKFFTLAGFLSRIHVLVDRKLKVAHNTLSHTSHLKGFFWEWALLLAVKVVKYGKIFVHILHICKVSLQ